jgi:AcrR family transcriptional regulator
MPAIINHADRRRALAERAADIIATGGLDALTVKAVAQAAGFSTKVVSHYFADKRDLLLATYRVAAQSSFELATSSQPSRGADVLAHLLSLLPTTPTAVRNWKVWFAFWGQAIADPEFSGEQARQIAAAESRLAELIRADPRFADLDAASGTQLAEEAMVTVLGVALRSLFDPANWPATRQRELALRPLSAAGLVRRSGSTNRSLDR